MVLVTKITFVQIWNHGFQRCEASSKKLGRGVHYMYISTTTGLHLHISFYLVPQPILGMYLWCEDVRMWSRILALNTSKEREQFGELILRVQKHHCPPGWPPFQTLSFSHINCSVVCAYYFCLLLLKLYWYYSYTAVLRTFFSHHRHRYLFTLTIRCKNMLNNSFGNPQLWKHILSSLRKTRQITPGCQAISGSGISEGMGDLG